MAEMHRVSAWFFRILLLVVALVVFFLANLPITSAPIGFANDKLNHAAAFAVLTPLLLFAFPGVRLVCLFGVLLSFNALIELSQGFLSLGRKPDAEDWLIGAVVSAAVLGLVAMDRAIQTSLSSRSRRRSRTADH
jgi:hypothetical protein